MRSGRGLLLSQVCGHSSAGRCEPGSTPAKQILGSCSFTPRESTASTHCEHGRERGKRIGGRSVGLKPKTRGCSCSRPSRGREEKPPDLHRARAALSSIREIGRVLRDGIPRCRSRRQLECAPHPRKAAQGTISSQNRAPHPSQKVTGLAVDVIMSTPAGVDAIAVAGAKPRGSADDTPRRHGRRLLKSPCH